MGPKKLPNRHAQTIQNVTGAMEHGGRAMKNSRRILLLMMNLFFTTVGVGWADLRPDFEEQWKAFRDQYPYHVQVVGLSAAASDGHRLLLISEPPPHVTVDGVRALDPRLTDASEKKKQSRTMSPRAEQSSIASAINCTGFTVGCRASRLPSSPCLDCVLTPG
jgi:hypothetical protein